MKTIVLVHGILGVGSELLPGTPLPFKPQFDYFNGVVVHLRQAGINVLAPTLSLLKAVEYRGEELARHLQALPAGRIDIIAHSMGGLDARYVLHHYPAIAARITSLTTIGTPHHGSAVADKTSTLFQVFQQHAPAWLLEQIGALGSLSTEKAAQFNRTIKEAEGVRYLNIAGVAGRDEQNILLRAAAAIGELAGPNDGVVLRESAHYQRHQPLPDWPLDHFGEIGWARPARLGFDAGIFYPAGHLERYAVLLATIHAIPERAPPAAP